MTDIIFRKEALKRGLKRYYTGKPCVRGHVAERYTNKRVCVECSWENMKTWEDSNKEKVLENTRERTNKWKKGNTERTKTTDRVWRQANKSKVAAYRAKYRANLLKATPHWADHEAITKIYEESARLTEETGILHHVDHDIPLQGELVSGLHCETNLVILTAIDNLSKGNKYVK